MLSDAIIYEHLSGKDGYGRDVVGLYPIQTDDTCYFLAIDFDGGDWQDNVREVRNIITLFGITSAKLRRETIYKLQAIPESEPLVIIATGKYVGEGFDYPRGFI